MYRPSGVIPVTCTTGEVCTKLTWLSWPHKTESWPGKFEPVPDIFAEIVRHLAAVEEVHINVAGPDMEEDVRGVLGSGIIALGLDAEEPQVFVTVSDDLVAKGIAAGDLVRLAVPSIDGRGGGRPEMAQGKGARREGLPAALEAIRDAVRTNGASGG